jgi:hypothetical protein
LNEFKTPPGGREVEVQAVFGRVKIEKLWALIDADDGALFLVQIAYSEVGTY